MAMQCKQVSLFCTACGKAYSNLIMTCSSCGGMIETRYESPSTPNRISSEALPLLERFWPVLPIANPTDIHVDIRSKAQIIRATRLRNHVGGPEIWLQNETTLPTGTTKDRAAATVFPFFRQFGVREFVLSSTGNTSNSFAYIARYYPDMRIHIFVGKDFACRLRYLSSPEVVVRSNVITHIVDGNFVQAGIMAKKFAEEHHLQWEGGFFNPGRRDGLKTAFLEAVLRIGVVPAYYVQAISSAMGVVGTAKAVKEVATFGISSKQPRLICVQQESCAPMVQAWNEGSPTIQDHHKIAQPVGIAKAILRGDPSATYPIIYTLVRASRGCFLAASVNEIKHAQKLLYELEGLWVCEAAACAVAGYIKLVQQQAVSEDGPVLINLTGRITNGLSA
jgi:threonine synthase